MVVMGRENKGQPPRTPLCCPYGRNDIVSLRPDLKGSLFESEESPTESAIS